MNRKGSVLVGVKELYEKWPRSRSSTYRDIKYRGFPSPISFCGSIFWDEALVDAWLEQLAATPYIPTPVAMPKPGKRRGRKSKITEILEVAHENENS